MYEIVKYETMPTVNDVLGYTMPQINLAIRQYILKHGRKPNKISLPKVYIYGMDVDFNEAITQPIVYHIEDKELIFKNE